MRFLRRRAAIPGRPNEAEAAANVDVGSATDVGRRADNQDRCSVDRRLAAVSDGMGGYRGGARAAQLCIDAVIASLRTAAAADDPEQRLRHAFTDANAAVRVARDTEPGTSEMGATLTVAIPTVASPVRSRWLIAHVGDSPAVVVTADATAAITADHTPAAELVAAGVLTEAEAGTHPGRHLLLRAIGPDPTVEVDVAEVTLHAGDALVVGSDGLSGTIDRDEIGTIVRAAGSASIAASDLVATAVARGASDNVTAVVVRQMPSSDV